MALKFNFKKGIATILTSTLLVGLASCNNNDEPPTIANTIVASIDNSGIFFNENGIWFDYKMNENLILYPAPLNNTEFGYDELLKIQFNFSHFYNGYPYGFTASKVSDTEYYPGEMYNHQFSVITGGGPQTLEYTDYFGTIPFIVGNWDAYTESNISSWRERTCLITLKQKAFDNNYLTTEFKPTSIQVTNTCYTYYSMLNGDAYSKKFEQGDYLKLIIHGVRTDDSEKTIEVYLANCQGSDQSKWFLKEWKKVDLTSFGAVKGIYFTMESSDNSAYGMNTPAFFGACDLRIENTFFFIDI